MRLFVGLLLLAVAGTASAGKCSTFGHGAPPWKCYAKENCRAEWGKDRGMVRHCVSRSERWRKTFAGLEKRARRNAAARDALKQCRRRNPGIAYGVDWFGAQVCGEGALKRLRLK